MQKLNLVVTDFGKIIVIFVCKIKHNILIISIFPDFGIAFRETEKN